MALVVLGLLIAPVFGLKIGQSSIDVAGQQRPGVRRPAHLSGRRRQRRAHPDRGAGARRQADAAVAAAARVDGVRIAVVGGDARRPAVVDVVPDEETVDSASNEVVDDVRTAVEGATEGNVGVTGAGAIVQDYFSAVYDKFPYVMALIALITFILLVRTFRSLLLPIKAVVLNLVSLAAVFGAVTWFWQEGHGSEAVFGISATGAITFWLPVIIFAFLFGLSMDYEVFILARMREEYDATGDTAQAVVTGLGRTGRLVTSAALILFFAFAALASSPGTDIKVWARRSASAS